MAEKSIFWPTNNTGDGTGTGYTSAEMFQVYRSLFTSAPNFGGVTPDFQDELASTGAVSPVAVGAGAALVYGIFYGNTSAVYVTIPTPAVNTRIDRIVLRASWVAQTVRITRIAGTEGGSAPNLTQSAGTTWDVPLAQVSITTAGIITVTDQREWVGGVGNGVVDNTKLADMVAATLKGRAAGGGSGDPSDLNAAQVRALLNVADGANAYVHPNHTGDVTSNSDGATTIANKAVTNAKLADMPSFTIKGRLSFGDGEPQNLSVSDAQTVLAVPTLTHDNFAPELHINGVATGITFSVSGAHYSKLNRARILFVSMKIALSSKGSQSGVVTIPNLPFAAFENFSGVSVAIRAATYANFASSVQGLRLLIPPNSNTGTLYYDNGANTAAVTNAQLTNTSTFELHGSFLYE